MGGRHVSPGRQMGALFLQPLERLMDSPRPTGCGDAATETTPRSELVAPRSINPLMWAEPAYTRTNPGAKLTTATRWTLGAAPVPLRPPLLSSWRLLPSSTSDDFLFVKVSQINESL